MAEWRPYFLVGYKSCTASVTSTLKITTGATEEFECNEIRIKATSENFDITKIVDQGGTPFTNADTSSPLDARLLMNDTENNYNVIKLMEPWNLPPQTTLSFDIDENSGSTNEVWVLLIGRMKTV